ncbi:MAG TPA: glycosyltransferase [Opitutaceae bacterium]|nr:glycosyltransferase [Opitutaceae bacterium]
MQVSFIIPLYNCLPLTQAMVASLQATLPRNLTHEIILVDDGSTDGTREWLATLDAPFRVVLNERNLGYAAANNRGAARASGEFLALLNNDLVLMPGWLEPMLDTHRQLGANAGLIGNVQLDARNGAIDHAGIFFNHKGKPEHARELPSPFTRLFRSYQRVDAVTGACVLVGRALWMQLGGFDEGYVNGCEDVDLALRADAAGRVNAVTWRSVIHHHVSSSPGRKVRDEQNTRRFTQRWRAELVRRSVRRWCWNYYETSSLNSRQQESALAWRIWMHALGVSHTPPPEALAGTEAAIDAELVRWEKMFGR